MSNCIQNYVNQNTISVRRQVHFLPFKNVYYGRFVSRIIVWTL